MTIRHIGWALVLLSLGCSEGETEAAEASALSDEEIANTYIVQEGKEDGLYTPAKTGYIECVADQFGTNCPQSGNVALYASWYSTQAYDSINLNQYHLAYGSCEIIDEFEHPLYNSRLGVDAALCQLVAYTVTYSEPEPTPAPSAQEKDLFVLGEIWDGERRVSYDGLSIDEEEGEFKNLKKIKIFDLIARDVYATLGVSCVFKRVPGRDFSLPHPSVDGITQIFYSVGEPLHCEILEAPAPTPDADEAAQDAGLK